MAWMWEDFQHYKQFVNPVELDTLPHYNNALLGPVAMRVSRLAVAVHELEESLDSLRALGFTEEGNPNASDEAIARAFGLCEAVVRAGETALLIHMPLATSDHAYGFLHQHAILTHWERYASTRRLPKEICRLVEDSAALLNGYHVLAEEDNRFLAVDLALPDRLGADFLIARDMFSVGHDEMGLFAASRGLEGVLRETAKARRLRVRRRNEVSGAEDLPLYDLIEYFYRLQWRKGGERVLAKSLRALLHYLRQIRNAGAHSEQVEVSLQPRETALIITAAANQLWHKIAKSKARLRLSLIDQSWGRSEGD